MSMKAKGVMKAWKTIKVNPYITKVYSPGALQNPQRHFPGMKPRAIAFDFSLRIPRRTVLRARKHVRRHKQTYILTASGGAASFAGSKLAQQRKRRRK